MNDQTLKYLTDHPKNIAITCASILGFIINLDLNRIVNTIFLSAIGAVSGYLATRILEMFLKHKVEKRS